MKGIMYMLNTENEGISIIIGADLLPTINNYDLFSNGNILELLGGELWDIIENVDFRVFDLEGPLTDIKSPILKDGPILSAPESTIAGFSAMQVDLLALANNHIRDHGTIGIQNTIKLIEDNGISYVGSGKNHTERSQVYYFRKNGICIGFYNCCENEESVVSEGEYGANPYDPLDSFDDVQSAKEKCDFLIVLYHGGKEFLRYPSPLLMRRLRKFAEKGADVVIAQHTHCIGCYENYEGSLLIYGQGNFIFDRSDNEYFANGLLVNLKIGSFCKKGYQYEFVPVQKHGGTVRKAEGKEAKLILDSFEQRSSRLQDVDFIKNEYIKRADEYILSYLNSLRGVSWVDRLGRIILGKKYNRFLKNIIYSPKVITHIKNYISCESHQELLLAGLCGLIREGENKNE